MENGVLVLGMIALLFICMYGYAYGTVALDNIAERKKEAELDRVQGLKKAERLEKEKLRNAKIAKLKKRSDEIRLEMKRLEKVDFSALNKSIVERMKESMAGEQQAETQTAS